MKLGEFIKQFSHNNIIRLHYKCKDGHELVSDDVSMDWEINKQRGVYRHYINNKVLGLLTISGYTQYSEALNIEIEKLDNQPYLEEIIEDKQKTLIIGETYLKNDRI